MVHRKMEEVELLERTWDRHLWRWRMLDNGIVSILGQDLGAETKEIYRKENYAVWHTKGSTGWAGIGMTSYYPPIYWVVRNEKPELAQLLYEVKASRKTWRKCKTLCIAKIDELIKGEQHE